MPLTRTCSSSSLRAAGCGSRRGSWARRRRPAGAGRRAQIVTFDNPANYAWRRFAAGGLHLLDRTEPSRSRRTSDRLPVEAPTGSVALRTVGVRGSADGERGFARRLAGSGARLGMRAPSSLVPRFDERIGGARRAISSSGVEPLTLQRDRSSAPTRAAAAGTRPRNVLVGGRVADPERPRGPRRP